MTATTPEHSVTKVPCILCRNEFKIKLDNLRALIEHGGQPHCGCKPKPVKVSTAKTKRTRGAPQGRAARSKADLLLLAIRALEEADGTAPCVPTIIVTAWRETPQAFGLALYRETYPDSNRIIMELVKMASHGLVHRPAVKHYALTAAGLDAANLLLPAGAAA